MDGLNRDRCLDTPKLVMSLVGLVLLLVACVNVAWGYQHSTISVRRVARTRVLMTSSHYENAVAMATKSVASSEVLMKFSRSDLTKLLEDELEDGIDKLDPDTSDLIQKTSDAAFSAVTGLANFLVNTGQNETQRNIPVLRTMQRIEKDMKMLDDVAGQTPQLTNVEVALLGSSVVLSAISPTFLSMKVVEVLVPSMAALAAAVGISAEYVGRVAVANGKEISSLAMQAAAEAEGVLAQAERAKAIMPLCVGISTSASAFALLAPALVAELNQIFGIQLIMNEVLIVFPLVSVLSAAIANLAAEESIQLSNRASNTGLRRFASSKTVGVTWKSQAEQVTAASDQTTQKWWSFAYSVIPAPIVAAIWPGNFALSCIVCSAFAAAQAAYYLANAEYSVGSASVQVAIKAKAAAVSDTYANQGSRAGSVLPFTSALAGLCAAASTAVVEVVPLVSIVELQSLIAVVFPTGAAMFAAAAGVSKARCEVDAAAAANAATRGLGNVGDPEQDPNNMVAELLKATLKTYIGQIRKALRRARNLFYSGRMGEIARIKLSRAISKLAVNWSVLDRKRKPNKPIPKNPRNDDVAVPSFSATS